MGCNCSKDSTPLSLKQKLRREFKQKVADIKKIWNETGDNKITSTKDELGFKPKDQDMLKKFDEYIKSRGVKEESFIPDAPKSDPTSNGKEVAGLKEVIEIEGLGKMKVKLTKKNK